MYLTDKFCQDNDEEETPAKIEKHMQWVHWLYLSKALNFMIPCIFGIPVMPFFIRFEKKFASYLLFKKNNIKVLKDLFKQLELSSIPILPLDKNHERSDT